MYHAMHHDTQSNAANPAASAAAAGATADSIGAAAAGGDVLSFALANVKQEKLEKGQVQQVQAPVGQVKKEGADGAGGGVGVLLRIKQEKKGGNNSSSRMHAGYFRAIVEQKKSKKRASPGADGSKVAPNGTVEQKAGESETWKLESLANWSSLPAAVAKRHETYGALHIYSGIECRVIYVRFQDGRSINVQNFRKVLVRFLFGKGETSSKKPGVLCNVHDFAR
jgi:hypothetical protein